MPPKYQLTHGQILHGFQYEDDYWGMQPTASMASKAELAWQFLHVDANRMVKGFGLEWLV